ncbi:hypothetical protein F220043C3_50540 [Enterocloster asparagiformis]
MTAYTMGRRLRQRPIASNKKPAGMASVQTIPAGFDAFYLKRFAGNDAPAFMTLNIKTAAAPAYTAP